MRESQFTVLRKCQSKFDCLVFEMLFIKKLKPNLNIQTDSIRAKLFVWYFLTLQFFNQLLLFFSIYRPKITNLFWLDNDVQPTSKRRRFLAIFFNLEMILRNVLSQFFLWWNAFQNHFLFLFKVNTKKMIFLDDKFAAFGLIIPLTRCNA